MPKTVILDVFSGTGSIAKAIRDAGWTDEYFVIELDMEPKSEPMDNVITLNCDITKLEEKDLKEIVDKYGMPDFMWFSPPCENYTNIKNSVYSRDLEKANATFNSALFIIDTIKKWKPDVSFAMENPKSKHFTQLTEKLEYYIDHTSYCLWNEEKTINGYSFNTFPYRKNTMIVSNIPNLNLKECTNDCKMCSNGRHNVVISFYHKYGQQIYQHYHAQLKRRGIYDVGHTPTDGLHQVPSLLIRHILS